MSMSRKKEWILAFLSVTAGSALAAFAIEEFLVPVTILDGGVVGISIIISQLSGISLGLLTFVINIPFLIVGLKKMGKRFFIFAIYAMLLFSILLSVFEEFHNATEDPLLGVAFGGFFLGAGVGLVLRGGGCLDGTEIVALLISRKTNFSVGQIVFGVNIIIYSAAGILFGPDRAMYSLLTYFISFRVIDIVEKGLEQAKSVMIITNDGKAIADQIYKDLGRTCTIMEGAGMISGDKMILYCVITRIEIPEIRRIVRDADQSAFVTISDINEIVGNHIKSAPKNTEPLVKKQE